MLSFELLILIVVAIASLIITLFIIKKVLKLLYYCVLIILAFFPGYYFGEYFVLYLQPYMDNRTLLVSISYSLSFLSFYIVLIFFINIITKNQK